jgi:hypothetical protein
VRVREGRPDEVNEVRLRLRLKLVGSGWLVHFDFLGVSHKEVRLKVLISTNCQSVDELLGRSPHCRHSKQRYFTAIFDGKCILSWRLLLESHFQCEHGCVK